MGQPSPTASRRSFLKGGGACVVSIGMAVSFDTVFAVGSAYARGERPPLLPTELASYLAVNADGSIAVFFGKTDAAQGLYTAIAQIVAEELDAPFESVTVYMGDTATTLNQGGASGSTGVRWGGRQMRVAAAEARRVLVELAAASLQLPADRLNVADGVVYAKDDPARTVSYAALIGGRYFNVQLDWNRQFGNLLYAPGKAKPKSPGDYKIVGQPLRRKDIAPKVFAQEDYVTDVRVPGMVHARMIRPPVAGASPVSVDEGSIKAFGGAKVVRQGAFLAVVADTEWDAVKAAQALQVEWTRTPPPFPDMSALYDHIRRAPVQSREVDKPEVGDVDTAFKQAARIVEADYEWPFQSHASMGPGCAVVEIKDGHVTVWNGSPKPHFCRDGVAAILGVPVETVHGISLSGSGAYGRNDAGDTAIEAAIIAKAVGRPVRLQHMRADATGWDPKGPASIHRVRAAIDGAGRVTAYEFTSKAFSRFDVNFEESNPRDTLGGQLLGVPLKPGYGFGFPINAYRFDAIRLAAETIAALLDRASPLRTSHLRDPAGPQIHFAHECFIDELAFALNADPVEFRLRHLNGDREIAVIKAAADKAGWETRPSPRAPRPGDMLTGRGIAYSQRDMTHVAVVAEVEVNRRTGHIWVRKMTVAHDCGLVVNPKSLRHTIESNIIHGISRALWEEVTFDTRQVTSVDWSSYRIMDMSDMPETVDIVLLDHPEIAPSGAGEPSIRPVAAAIGNAVFDATGIRPRRVPFSPDRMKALFS